MQGNVFTRRGRHLLEVTFLWSVLWAPALWTAIWLSSVPEKHSQMEVRDE